MPFDSRRTRTLVAATGGVALAALLAASPARADGDMWNSMLGWVGMGHKTDAAAAGPDDGAIDYTPKPALVVPPKMDLPPPQAATATPTNWPHDPDATARAEAEADSRRPAPSSDSSADNNSGDFVADADKAKPDNGQSEACTQQAGKPICFYGPSGLMNFTKGWGNWGGMFQTHPEDTSKLRIGSEPPREYLVQPPPGYQMPKVKDEDSDADADADASKYDNVDVGAPRHHHHHSDDSSASNN